MAVIQADMPSLMKTGRPPDVVVGHAWPALLALTQANRDTAAALLLAMQTHGDPAGNAMQLDELNCWYNDAHGAADVASHAADTLKLLTTSELTGAVGAFDAGLKLGGNIDESITDDALAERLRCTIAHDAAEVDSHAADTPKLPLVTGIPATHPRSCP